MFGLNMLHYSLEATDERIVCKYIVILWKCINSLSLAEKTDPCANSVDPDETARHEPSHQDLHCLPFRFRFYTETPICFSGHVQIQGWNSPLEKFRDKRVQMRLQNQPSCKLPRLRLF